MAAFEATRVVNLVAGDGESFQVPVGAALLSKLVETMFDADAAPEEVQEIPLPNVTKETLQKITEFLTHFYSDSEENKKKVSEIPKPIMSTKMSEVVPQWYADYLAVEQATVFAVLLGANYMNITELVHLACATIASWAKCKTPQEIMQTFGITEDFTEEEIRQVKAENKELEERMKRAKEEEAAAAGGASSASGAN